MHCILLHPFKAFCPIPYAFVCYKLIIDFCCCPSLLATQALPTVRRPVPLPQELRFLMPKTAGPQPTETTVTVPGVYYLNCICVFKKYPYVVPYVSVITVVNPLKYV